jgi:hypothetical protein
MRYCEHVSILIVRHVLYKYGPTYLFDIFLGRLVSSGGEESKTLDLAENFTEPVKTSNDGLLIIRVLEVRNIGNDGVEGGGDGHATTALSTTAEVLADGDGVGVLVAEGSLNTGGPLKRAGHAVSALDLVEENGTNIGGSLSENAGTISWRNSQPMSVKFIGRW